LTCSVNQNEFLAVGLVGVKFHVSTIEVPPFAGVMVITRSVTVVEPWFTTVISKMLLMGLPQDAPARSATVSETEEQDADEVTEGIEDVTEPVVELGVAAGLPVVLP